MRIKKGFESICKPLQCRCNILSTNNKVAKLGKIEQKFTDNRPQFAPSRPSYRQALLVLLYVALTALCELFGEVPPKNIVDKYSENASKHSANHYY